VDEADTIEAKVEAEVPAPAGAVAGATAGVAAEGIDVSRVLARLERIDDLHRGRGAGGDLLGELRALVVEAEAWARVEGDARARAAAARLRERTEGMR
jgi:hypothetical protein